VARIDRILSASGVAMVCQPEQVIGLLVEYLVFDTLERVTVRRWDIRR